MKDLEKLQVADKSYYITANTILSLAAKASKLFKVSKPEQKREILNLVLLNCNLDDGNVVYDLKKPFDTVLEYASRSEWLRSVYDVRTIFINTTESVYIPLMKQNV